jgi:hypothetical protein
MQQQQHVQNVSEREGRVRQVKCNKLPWANSYKFQRRCRGVSCACADLAGVEWCLRWINGYTCWRNKLRVLFLGPFRAVFTLAEWMGIRVGGYFVRQTPHGARKAHENLCGRLVPSDGGRQKSSSIAWWYDTRGGLSWPARKRQLRSGAARKLAKIYDISECDRATIRLTNFLDKLLSSKHI